MRALADGRPSGCDGQLILPADGSPGRNVCLACAPVLIVFANPLARFGARWRVAGVATEILQDMRRLFGLHSNGLLVIGLCLVVHAISIVVLYILSKLVPAQRSRLTTR